MIRTQLQSNLSMLKNNPRLLFGGWAILLILWLYGLLEMNDRLEYETQRYNDLVSKVKHVQGSSAKKDWLKRQEEARKLLSEVEVAMWSESTPGLAQAASSDWLAQAAQEVGIQNTQITAAFQESRTAGVAMENELDGNLTIWKVSTKLISEFNPAAYYRLLDKVTNNEKKLKIESLKIHTLPSPKAELVLVAYFSPAISSDKSNAKKINVDPK